MSPEQIRDEPVDASPDISFGLVLYEMATGVRAFAGDRESLAHAVLNLEQPPLKQLAPKLSFKLQDHQ